MESLDINFGFVVDCLLVDLAHISHFVRSLCFLGMCLHFF